MEKPIKLFMGFLLFTLIVEIIASIPVIAHFSEYRYFQWISETPFENNAWTYNIYNLVNPIVISFYFFNYINDKKFRKFIQTMLVLFVSISIYIFYRQSIFEDSSIIVIFGTIIILLVLLKFFYELLKSEVLLRLMKHLPMYIAVGVFVFNLVTTPLTIFSDYFSTSSGNGMFVKLQVYVILFSNIFMYSIFIIGFLACSKKKKFS